MKQLVKANPKASPKGRDHFDKPTLSLAISEFFYDSIQGEGVTAGYPAAFLRLSGCMLDCAYCDTKAIRDSGNTYTFTELFNLMELNKLGSKMFEPDLITKLKQGQHLVITGGSPLKQQTQLIAFLEIFIKEYKFKPFIEVENECTIIPEVDLLRIVNQWNNSPKLNNSGNPYFTRYKPAVLKILSYRSDSWFKFVVCTDDDWKEIETDYIKPGHISKYQIILMPQGKTRKEILKNSKLVIELAVRKNVRFSLREQIILWDNKIGV